LDIIRREEYLYFHELTGNRNISSLSLFFVVLTFIVNPWYACGPVVCEATRTHTHTEPHHMSFLLFWFFEKKRMDL